MTSTSAQSILATDRSYRIRVSLWDSSHWSDGYPEVTCGIHPAGDPFICSNSVVSYFDCIPPKVAVPVPDEALSHSVVLFPAAGPRRGALGSGGSRCQNLPSDPSLSKKQFHLRHATPPDV